MLGSIYTSKFLQYFQCYTDKLLTRIFFYRGRLLPTLSFPSLSFLVFAEELKLVKGVFSLQRVSFLATCEFFASSSRAKTVFLQLYAYPQRTVSVKANMAVRCYHGYFVLCKTTFGVAMTMWMLRSVLCNVFKYSASSHLPTCLWSIRSYGTSNVVVR